MSFWTESVDGRVNADLVKNWASFNDTTPEDMARRHRWESTFAGTTYISLVLIAICLVIYILQSPKSSEEMSLAFMQILGSVAGTSLLVAIVSVVAMSFVPNSLVPEFNRNFSLLFDFFQHLHTIKNMSPEALRKVIEVEEGKILKSINEAPMEFSEAKGNPKLSFQLMEGFARKKKELSQIRGLKEMFTRQVV